MSRTTSTERLRAVTAFSIHERIDGCAACRVRSASHDYYSVAANRREISVRDRFESAAGRCERRGATERDGSLSDVTVDTRRNYTAADADADTDAYTGGQRYLMKDKHSRSTHGPTTLHASGHMVNNDCTGFCSETKIISSVRIILSFCARSQNISTIRFRIGTTLFMPNLPDVNET